MAKATLLNVKGEKILSTKLTYDDLVVLYEQYIETYGEVPNFSKCDLKHNLPQGRIINRILADEGITYNDFLLKFGKVSHVRSESKDYGLYLRRFKQISDDKGHALTIEELRNNAYGLPSANWLVKYCPDKKVKTYNDFVIWCGYDSNKLEKDKDFVRNTLINLEKELGRPITKDDISLEKTGFSMIVLNRLFGGLKNAKKELGLMPTPTNQPNPFEYYKNNLDDALNNIGKSINRKYISWADIESGFYSRVTLEHKSLTNAFKREGIDIFSYIKSKGFMMNPSSFSYHYTFDDGERVVSTMEYDFSSYLRSIGFKYNEDYFRDVLYRTFSNEKSKMNCDYVILINGIPLYIEIAGLIYSYNGKDWRTYKYSSKKENEYRDKMIKKEQRLVESNCSFLFLFQSEMHNGKYREMFQEKLKEFRKVT